MNILHQKFNATLEKMSSFNRDVQLRRAIGEFSLALQAADNKVDNIKELRKSAVYQEARAINAYLHSDPFTTIGLGQAKIAERSMARARKCKNWNDALEIQHKDTRAVFDTLMDFDGSSQGGMLPSNIETLGEIVP